MFKNDNDKKGGQKAWQNKNKKVQAYLKNKHSGFLQWKDKANEDKFQKIAYSED